MRKIGRYCCKRIKRCVKKKVFGVPEPKLHEYEIAGVNLGNLKDNILPSKRGSVNSTSNKAKGKNRTMSMLYLKDLELIEGMNANELTKKFSVSPSKAKVLDKLLEDYKKGHLSVAALSDKPRLKQKKKLNKEKLNKMIQDYEDLKKRRKSRSLKLIDKLKEMDPTELKKKFSLSSSRQRIFTHMVDDYRNRKLSFSKLSNKPKFSVRKISKGQVNQMLQEYETNKKKLKLPFSFHNKLGNLEPLIDEIKNTRISISSIKRRVFK